DKLASGRVKPSWPDIPYHYYISIDGRIGEARPPEFAGDTNTEYDPTGHLLIVLEGNFNEEQVPDVQWASLVQVTRWAAAKWRVPAYKIGGHRDFSAQTDCPGANVIPRLPELRRLVRLGS
ncbi:MAG: peptidoglycan recognition protein family protein, partial [Fimbriimonadaceae bacterium]|nr:peptidoglycan recognition protein family protein [Fimbriimonadaceae bacterium]